MTTQGDTPITLAIPEEAVDEAANVLGWWLSHNLALSVTQGDTRKMAANILRNVTPMLVEANQAPKAPRPPEVCPACSMADPCACNPTARPRTEEERS